MFIQVGRMQSKNVINTYPYDRKVIVDVLGF